MHVRCEVTVKLLLLVTVFCLNALISRLAAGQSMKPDLTLTLLLKELKLKVQ